MGTVAATITDCLGLSSDSLVRWETEVSNRRRKDELGRLRIWAANIGAHQRGQPSLDYQLQDASHIATETGDFLSNPRELLLDLREVMGDSPDLGDDDGEDAEAIYLSNMTEVLRAYKGLVEVIDYLYRMSTAIRRPADKNKAN
ncbi:hypothetical protein BDV10DRAFT_162924 [Aspergillus recurvatus]